MDSMRSLNTSLPASQSRRSPAPELLQAFKSAALTVTNLYKTAVAEQATTVNSGYQDAIEDLLSFLDRENLGLKDGEGWKIRQWATERFEARDATHNSTDSDEDRADTAKRARSSSAASPARTNHEGLDMRDHSNSDASAPRREAAATLPAQKEEIHPPVTERPPIFTFSAAQALPNRDIPMHISDTSSSDPQASNHPSFEISATQATNPVRVEVVNRGARIQSRNINARHSSRSSNRDFAFTGGTKRKFQLPEFFDISNAGTLREGANAGKRGRHV